MAPAEFGVREIYEIAVSSCSDRFKAAVSRAELTLDTLICVVCIVMRMPRISVYLPEDLYRDAKAQKMPVSEMLQDAIRAESKRLAFDEWYADVIRRHGPPTPEQEAAAEEWARPIIEHLKRSERLYGPDYKRTFEDYE